jgi:hypothetical protein
MIAVKWEFEGTGPEVAATQTVVERILNRYQRALRGLTCPVHGSGAVLVVRGRTLEDLDLGIEPCCQSLIDEANAQIHRGRRRRGVVLQLDRPARSRPDRRKNIRRSTRIGNTGRRTAQPS